MGERTGKRDGAGRVVLGCDGHAQQQIAQAGLVDSAFSRMATTLAPRWRTIRRRELISSVSPLRERAITISWPVTAVL